jgi:hypothetical protein
MSLDPAIQRITLLDPPTVLGWIRWRELDEQYTLGGLRGAMRRLAEEGRIPATQKDVLANMLLAALNEAALFVAYAQDPGSALARAEAAVDTLLDRLASASGSRA